MSHDDKCRMMINDRSWTSFDIGYHRHSIDHNIIKRCKPYKRRANPTYTRCLLECLQCSQVIMLTLLVIPSRVQLARRAARAAAEPTRPADGAAARCGAQLCGQRRPRDARTRTRACVRTRARAPAVEALAAELERHRQPHDDRHIEREVQLAPARAAMDGIAPAPRGGFYGVACGYLWHIM